MNRKERRKLKREGKLIIPEPSYQIKPSQMVEATVSGIAKDAMHKEIQKQVLAADKLRSIDTDAMVLWTLHRCCGWGFERLKRFYVEMFKEHLRMRKVYEMDDLYPEKYKLKEQTGVDVDAWWNALFNDDGSFKNPEEIKL